MSTWVTKTVKRVATAGKASGSRKSKSKKKGAKGGKSAVRTGRGPIKKQGGKGARTGGGLSAAVKNSQKRRKK